MSEPNKAIVRRYFDAVNTRDVRAYDDIVDTAVTFHGMQVSSGEQLKVKAREIVNAFPDMSRTVEHLVAEGDKVAAMVTAKGTHAGEFEGIPATGRTIDNIGEADIFRIRDGRIVEAWHLYDAVGFMRQLGRLPEPGRSSPMSRTIVDQLVKLWADGDADGIVALCNPDALCDCNVPQWRYQVHPDALLENMRMNTEMPDRSTTIGYHEPTRDGAVVEVETRGTLQGEPILIRELWTVRTDGEKITEWIMYCTGGWDAATVARQRAEAPMIRP